MRKSSGSLWCRSGWCSSFEMIPELVFGAGARDLVTLDVGALGPGAAATVTHTRRRAVRIDTLGSLGCTYGISGE